MILLLTLLIKSLLVFALASAALLALRRASAAARHLVCLLTLAALLALPLFSLTLPSWHLPLVVQTQMSSPPPVGALLAAPSSATPASDNSLSAGTPSAVTSKGTEEMGAAKEGAASSTPTVIASKTVTRRFFWPFALITLYVLGVLLAGLRPMLGLWGIARLNRACIDINDPPTLTVAFHCAGLLHLRTPRLCRADVSVPMTWGWRLPVVLLPTESAEWPEDRLQSVLLHEMAHIKRRDWLSHRLADLICALYWFHPLVWLTVRRLRTEGELACDDLVLTSGIAASDYARHLLEIAGTLSRIPNQPQAAIAMAQTSHVEGRILMILDKTHPCRLNRRALRVALIPCIALLVTLAVLNPTVKAHVTPSALVLSTTSAQTYVDDNGTKLVISPDRKINGTLLFAGISDDQNRDSLWWNVQGDILSQPVYPKADNNAIKRPGFNEYTFRQFAFQLPPTAKDVTVQYKMPLGVGWSCDGQWPGKSSSETGPTEAQLFVRTAGTRVVTAQFPTSVAKANIQVGIASGPWNEAASRSLSPNGTTHFSGPDFVIGEVTETAKGHSLTVSTDSTDDLRIVGVNTQGHEFLPDSIGGNSDNKLNQITAQFNMPLAQIKEIRVETRPFQWIEYKDVALQPVK